MVEIPFLLGYFCFMNRLLVIGYVWPEPRSSAAGTRMMQLLEFFKNEGFSVTFGTTAARTPYSEDLKEIGINIHQIELNSGSFDEFLKEIKPGMVLFDRFMMEEQFGWRVAKICPEAIRILDTEDLHFLRKARQEAHKKGTDLKKAIFESDIAKREVASIYRCDLSLIISEMEMEILINKFQIPDHLLFYLPFLIEELSAEAVNRLPGFEARKHFLSIGNFLHEPNWDAVLNLKQNIWPLIRKKFPEAELHIYGAYASEKVKNLHNKKEGFVVKGRAPDAHEVLEQARVLLAPLRFGAGLKGKFTDAMQSGTPSVTTSIGAEGMLQNGLWNGKIEEDPVAFANAAVQLYQDKEIWQEAQQKGFELLKRSYPKRAFQENFKRRLTELNDDLKEHRLNNFTGSMLMHHRLSSTKYLSKYIEAKNKLKND